MKETPEERKKRLLDQLARGRETRRKKKEAAAQAPQPEAPVGEYVRPPKRPRNLDKIIREILNDDEFVDAVVANQPEWWGKLPTKSAAYITASVMIVKAMGGDIKAADWVAKRGFGDKVVLDADGGFFAKSDFTIQVLPSKNQTLLNDPVKADDVLKSEIKQIDDTTGPSDTKSD